MLHLMAASSSARNFLGSMEARRLIWLMALLFSVVLLVQYIQLPYGYVLSSLLSFGKSQVASAGSFLTEKEALNGTITNDLIRSEKDKHSNGSSVVSSNSRMNHSSTDDETPPAGNTTLSPGQSFDFSVSSSDNSAPNSSLPPPNSEGSNRHPWKKRWIKGPPSVVVPISTMNEMLMNQSRDSYQSLQKPLWPSQADGELLNAKTLIQNREFITTSPQIDADIYRNYSTFLRSYELMEKMLKIYVYSEGDRPIFHQPVLDGIYASEGWFMKQIQESKQFVTKNASKAHLFYLPFSSRVLQETLYVRESHNRKNLVAYLSDYIKTISRRYRFWNRTSGADHFIVACHDWAPSETRRIMKSCIRALCNADVRGGFKFGKDVSLPETYVRDALDPTKDLGGKPPSERHILAFFAGNMHGYLRPILLHYWENKDPDMKIFGRLSPGKGQMSYSEYMKSSKYCISAKGYEAYTPRVMEAIFYECVPVIVSDNYVPPFFETLNWEAFAVFILEKDIVNLKTILGSIPEQRYLEMQERVRKVQKHFLWHKEAVKHDIFHMIIHSMWYTRVFQMRPPPSS